MAKPKDIELLTPQQIIIKVDFIPAQESSVFMRIFRIYVNLLFRRRFKHIWIRQEYHPTGQSKTVYFLNHNSWWDGLIPFLLNEYRFYQQARALMEAKQLEKYTFFRKIGAFSINRDDPRKAVTSMRYAVQSFQRPNASLFIYPEGTITPPGTDPDFEGGLAWLHDKLPKVEFVPVGIYMHTIRHDKPELHLYVGEPVEIAADESNETKTALMESALSTLLQQMKKTAGFRDEKYKLFWD